MYPFALNMLLICALTAISPEPAAPPAGREAPRSRDLMSAMRASDFAEIYVIDRSIRFPIAPGPDAVRGLGCRYRVWRESPHWRDLERALEAADVRMEPTAETGEVRIALVLGDRRGTVHETYARLPYGTQSRVTGFSQREQVVISASFVHALEGFASRYPELALASPTPIPTCPGETRR